MGSRNLPTWSTTSVLVKRSEHGLVLRQVAAVELQLHVPAERRNSGGHCFENFPRQGRARQHEEADAARAKLGQPVKLKIGHALHRQQRCNARLNRSWRRLRACSDCPCRRWTVEQRRCARYEARAHLPIGRDGRIGRHELRGCGLRIFAVVDMHVGVAGAGGRPELRRDVALNRRHSAHLRADIAGAVRVRKTADGLRQQMLRKP